MAPLIRTELTEALGIRYPLLLAGMAKVSNAKLAAAVTRAGGCGVIGGVSKTPEQLRGDIRDLKALIEPGASFGIDLLLPQVGGNARKTNKDYTKGSLPELIDIICAEQPRLFVAAVGVPPKWAVDKLHAAGILVANMVGHPKHAEKALAVGADVLIAQGGEGGGHTGELATSVLVPQVVDVAHGRKNFRGGNVLVVAAGGVYDGRHVAMALSLGASGVWVGTRFIVAEESGASSLHQKLVCEADSSDTIRTTIYTGRPCRVLKNAYNLDMEQNQRARVKELETKGIIAFAHDIKNGADCHGNKMDLARTFPQFAGQAVGGITRLQPAAEIIESMMDQAAAVLLDNAKRVQGVARL
jgi:NAD(P)H-dependent flavin oxidoreductase YrpB (nitropropane dioxygenase family)